MATFVDTTSEEEQILTLVQYVTNLKKKGESEKEGGEQKAEAAAQFNNECTRLLQESRTEDVILKIISETDAIFSDQNDKEIENGLTLISALIGRQSPPFPSGAQKLREQVASNSTDRPLLRLKILTNIYHASSSHRYDTFVTLAKYAHESKNAELMIPKFNLVDKWLNDWDTNVEQQRKLFLLIRRILKENNKGAQGHKFIVQYLQTFPAEATTPEVTALAVEAVLEAITGEDLFQADHLLDIPSVNALKNGQPELYKLLQIFAQDKLEAFLQFEKDHPELMKSKGIDTEQAKKKMRLLSIASLAGEAREIPYALIASTLQVPVTEVESWVIEAVSAKLLEAKMNQLKQTVSIGFCVQRVFTKDQWTSLATLLKKWQSSVSQLLTTVNQIQEVQVQ